MLRSRPSPLAALLCLGISAGLAGEAEVQAPAEHAARAAEVDVQPHAGPTGPAAEARGQAPADLTVRAVLRRVSSTYIRPERIDPDRMLEGALTAAARRLEGEREAAPDGLKLVWPEATLVVPAAGRDGGLVARLAPSLEQALDALAALPRAGERELTRNDLRGVLLDGALRTLDRYTSAFTAVRRGSLLGRYRGVMTGIGARIGRREESLVVLQVYPDTGAADAGLLAGDVLRRIDDTPVDGMTVSEAIRMLRGEEGTTVELEVLRDGPLWVPITRRQFSQPSVVELPTVDGIAALRITHLSKRTPDQFGELLDRIALDPQVRGLVLDLRGNGGGSMLAATGVADQFLGAGVLLETRGRDGGPVSGLVSRVVADRRGWTALPVAILADGATASSSELLTAALAWNDRALLVGQRTYGKNLIQKVFNYEDADLTVKLSSALFFSALQLLPDDGIDPDVWIRDGDVEIPDGAPLVVDPGEGEDAWLDRCRELLLAHGSPSRRAMLQGLRDAEAASAVADRGR